MYEIQFFGMSTVSFLINETVDILNDTPIFKIKINVCQKKKVTS